MLTVPRAEIPPRQWDAVVTSSPDGWVYGLTSWLDLIGPEPRWRLEEQSFGLLHEDQLVAVVPFHKIRGERRLLSSGWGFTGPIIAARLHPRFEERVLKAAFDEMRATAARVEGDRIEVAVSAVTRRSLANFWGVNPYVAHGYTDVSTHTQVVRLDQDEQSLWDGLSVMSRRHIRRAQNLGYTISIEPWDPVFEEFYRAHCQTYERSGLPPHPRAYFEGFGRHLAPAGYSTLLVGRDPAGCPVAFHNTFRFGPGAAYMTGASESAHLNSGINYFLFFEAILAAKRNQAMWYEAGEIAFPWDDAKRQGLSTFKSQFGGELHRYFRGSLAL